MAAVERLDRAHGHARRFHVDEDEGNAFLLLHGGVGAGEDENPVGILGERRPGLLAVDHPFAALALGGRLQSGEIGAGARLRKALAPPIVDIGDARQEACASAPPSRTYRSPARPCWCRRRATPGAPACCNSSLKISRCTGLQPVPPHSTGQCGTDQPFLLRMRVQATMSSLPDAARRRSSAGSNRAGSL